MSNRVLVMIGAESADAESAITRRFSQFVERWFPGTVVEYLEVPDSGSESLFARIMGGPKEAIPDVILLRHYIVEEEPESTEHLPVEPQNPWVFSISSNADPLEFLGWEDDGSEPASQGAQMLRVALADVLARN